MKKRSIMKINWQFPDDIIWLIFTKLPFFNLPSCREVCKAWNNLIILYSKFVTPISNHLYFVHISHHRNILHCFCLAANNGRNIFASFSFPPNLSNLKILGLCNGLICFTQSNNTTVETKTVCILNPLTNEYITLPRGTSLKGVFYSYGFGFSSKTNQYKVTRQSFKSGRSSHFTTSMEIFAFGTNQWRHVALMPLCLTCDGVYFNGAIYWLGCGFRGNVVCRLNLEDEKCEEISFPPLDLVHDNHRLEFALGGFNGSLYLTFYTLPSFAYHVFKMEISCGREEQDSYSWTRTFVISLLPNLDIHIHCMRQLRLIRTFENGKILCLIGEHLILYDPKIGTTELLEPSKRLEEILWNFQIDSLNFDSLHTILTR